MKNLSKLGKALDKAEQKAIHGGRGNCPIYPADDCLACGGNPRPNGCCLGTLETHLCLNGGGIGLPG